VFFPLADAAAMRAPPDPATLADRLGAEVIKCVGHEPDDDVALLVIYRDGGYSLRTPSSCQRVQSGDAASAYSKHGR
jgi:hypothetical protein